MNVTTFIQKYFTKFDKEECYTSNDKWHLYPKEDVFQAWGEYSSYSNKIGTLFHKLLETFLKGKEIEHKEITFKSSKHSELLLSQDLEIHSKVVFPDFFKTEFENFKEFYTTEIINKGYTVYCIEKEFKRAEMKGIIDAVFYNKSTDTYLIVDWKWNKKIDRHHTKMALFPYQKLPDNKYGKFCLQLFFYEFLLNKKTVKKMILRFYKNEIEKIEI